MIFIRYGKGVQLYMETMDVSSELLNVDVGWIDCYLQTWYIKISTRT